MNRFFTIILLFASFTVKAQSDTIYIKLGSASSGASGTVNTGTANRLGYYATTGSAISQLAAITASRALVSDANGLPTAAATTAAEIGYVSGVTSGIQAQLDAKLSIATAAATYSVLSHNHTIDGLSNVTITSKATGDVLRWNGSAWVNFIPPWLTSYTETDPKRVTGVAITGTTTKTVTITLADATTVSGTFTDNEGGGSAMVIQSHTSGATVTVNNATTWLIVNPATLLASLTVTLPATPTDGQVVDISFGGTITGNGDEVVTSFLVNPNSGQSLVGPATAGIVETTDHAAWRYVSSTSKWYRQ